MKKKTIYVYGTIFAILEIIGLCNFKNYGFRYHWVKLELNAAVCNSRNSNTFVLAVIK